MAQTDQPGMYGAFTIDAAGAWTYTLDNALDAVQGLSAGSTADDVFTVTASVNSAATQDITITITGANDAPTVTLVASSPTGIGNSDLFGDELNPGGVLTLTATAVDPDVNDALTFAWTEVPRLLDASLGSFSDATAAVTTWTAPASIAALYTTGLTVTVGDGATSTSQTFLISLADNVLAFPAPIPDQSYPQGVAISDLTLPAATGEGLRGIGTPTTYALDPVPAGLTFDDATRILSGTPTDAATSATTHTYTATDGESRISITFTINDFMPEFAATITPQTYPIGTAVSITLPEATSGNGALSYAITETLPDGLTFTATTRVLDGTPTTEQAATPYTYTATDSDTTNPDTAQLPFTITITDGSPNIVLAGGLRMTADEGEVVTLNAAGSSDVEGQAITMFQWAHTATDGGQPNPEITDTDAVPATFTFTAPEERTTLTFTLMITDGNNRTADATITVEVGRSSSERTLEKTLAAFGRAFATGTVGVFEDYLSTPGSSANTNYFTLGGHKFDMATTTPSAPVGTDRDLSVQTLPAQPDCRAQGCARGAENRKFSRAAQGGVGGLPPQTRASATTLMSGQDLLMKSAFHLNLNDATAASPGWSFWGRATTGNFNGDTESETADAGEQISVDGSVDSGYLGIDYLTPAGTRLGLAIAQSDGEIDYDEVTGGNTTSGDLEAKLTSILPYVQWQPGESTNAWLLLGYGTGDAELATDGADEATDVDIDMQMLAFGLRGDLDRAFSRTELSWKASAFAITIESDDQPDLGGVEADSQRLRFAVEGRRPGATSAGGGAFTPGWELGMRWEDGDIERGAAADAGLRFDYTNPVNGWSLSGAATSVLFSPEAYNEWTAGVQARLDPGAQGRGITFTLEPGWSKDGRSQQMGVDFSNALGKWSKRGLRLELTGERTERDDDDIGHNIRLTGSLRF